MHSLVNLIKKTYRMAGPRQGRVIMHNVAFLSGLQLISFILPLIVLPFLFRVIGPERFGLVFFSQALMQYLIILTDYGFNITATKEISICRHEQAKVRAVFSCVLTVKILLTVLAGVLLFVMIFFIPRFREDWTVYAFNFGAVVGSTLFPVWFYQGTEKMKYIARLNIIGEFIYALFIFTFVHGPQDYLIVPLTNSIVPLITGIIALSVVFTKFKVGYRIPQPRHIWRQLRLGWNIFISVVAINAYSTRVFVVGLMTNNALTGYYSIAEKMANVAQTFPLSSFSQAIFPRLSKIFHKNRAKAYQMMLQTQRITITIGLIFLPVIFALAPVIVRVICGQDYPEVVLTFRILLMSVFFVSGNAFRVQFLLVSGKTHIYSRIHVYAALAALPLIVYLIYCFSYAGAAMATVIVEAGVFTVTYFAVRKMSAGYPKSS
jgi:polysaccharide transporter, PST family